jgi:hypothetical protein
LVEVHPYTFWPAGASDLKKASPTVQLEGRLVPVLKGFVELLLEKSTLFVCVRRSIRVCACTGNASARAVKALKNLIATCLLKGFV